MSVSKDVYIHNGGTIKTWCGYLSGDWRKQQAASNLKKHDVSFEIATRVFTDPFAIINQDRFENGERRWQTLGIAEGYLLLLVAHTVQDDESGIEVIRIISARRAAPKERKRYEQNCSL